MTDDRDSTTATDRDGTTHAAASIEAIEVVDEQVLAAASAGDATVVVAAPTGSPPPAEALRTALRAVAAEARAHALTEGERADAHPSFTTAAGLRGDADGRDSDRARTDGGDRA